MKRTLYVLLLCCGLFTACGPGRTDEAVHFTDEDFEVKTLRYADAEKYRNDSLFLGDPYLLRVHPEGFLVFQEIGSDRLLTVVDLLNGTVARMIPRGKGPGEMLGIRDIVVDEGDICVSSLADSKVFRLSMVPGERRFVTDTVFRFPKVQFMRIMPWKKGTFLALASASSDNRMILLDEKGTVSDTVGSFPDFPDMMGRKPNNALLQSDLYLSPDRRHLAVVCRSIDCIDIYDGDAKLKRRLRGPLGAEVSFREASNNGLTRYFQEPDYLMFDHVAANDRKMLVGFVGVRIEKREDFDRYIQSIYAFDWNGKPLTKYALDKEILSFDVDWEHGKLYCLLNDPEPEIVTFTLDGL